MCTARRKVLYKSLNINKFFKKNPTHFLQRENYVSMKYTVPNATKSKFLLISEVASEQQNS
jgi:hypothetical protein